MSVTLQYWGTPMVHSVSRWMRGVQVKLWDSLRERAIPERLIGVLTIRRCTNPRLPYLSLHQAMLCYIGDDVQIAFSVWQLRGAVRFPQPTQLDWRHCKIPRKCRTAYMSSCWGVITVGLTGWPLFLESHGYLVRPFSSAGKSWKMKQKLQDLKSS